MSAQTVPDGTAVEVLNWVDGDPARARQALQVERAGQGRLTLTSRLETIAAKPAAQEATPMADEPATTDETTEEPEEVPAPVPPAGEDLSIDLVDQATYIGPVNVAHDEVERPDDTYDLVQAQAIADEAEESPVDATAVEVFQIASTSGVVVLNFDGTAVLLDANQAAALSKDLKTALAGVTY